MPLTYSHMKKIILFSILFVVIIFSIFQISSSSKSPQKKFLPDPDELLFIKRAFPYGYIDYNAYFASAKKALALRSSSDRSFNGSWVFAGPVNIGGRVTDIEMHPSDTSVIYAGMASGGIFKSLNGGQSWTSIFDDQPNISIGDIAIDPSDNNVIYAGTGEANASSNNGAFPGNGIYKSTDAGSTWIYKGLPYSQNIGRIVVDPNNSDNIFVAAMGQLYGTNVERGVYRSSDGGDTWQNVLFVNDTTGCIDIAINPDSSNIVYAAMWSRIKYSFGSKRCGTGSGIYKSSDGGNTWVKLTNGLPASNTNTSRIGIDISASNSNIVYAIYNTTTAGIFDGVYKSVNSGLNWTRVDDGSTGDMNNGYGWYFGNIRVDPDDPDIAYILGLDTWQTTNGGITWNDITYSTHVDHHALCINPLNTNHLINGNDGGIYISHDKGTDWSFLPNLPITQFYANDIDFQNPERLYGGTQDNGSMRTMTGGTDDWEFIYWNDGFYVVVDPTDNNIIYAESQYGELVVSYDGGLSFNPATNGIDVNDRRGWCTPVVLDPNNPSTLYIGANRLYRSDDNASNWYLVSNDLTNNLGYTSISTIAVAPSNSDVIYVGSDDGAVWVTQNAGTLWTNISSGLPLRCVSRVAVDPNNAAIAYVTLSGYRFSDYTSQIYRTTNYGQGWTDISGNLPDTPIDDIIVDPALDSTLYIGTDIGVFATTNLGNNWEVLGNNMPVVPVFDLCLQSPTRTLVAATYGRSMYKYTLSPITGISENTAPSTTVTNFPNPFNDNIHININILKSSQGDIKIFDMNGKLVKKIFSGNFAAGENTFTWNGLSDASVAVSKGIYFIRVQSGENIYISKILRQ
jgi:photosystem II stability/assembly factor-like uncharacterized protein